MEFEDYHQHFHRQNRAKTIVFSFSLCRDTRRNSFQGVCNGRPAFQLTSGFQTRVLRSILSISTQLLARPISLDRIASESYEGGFGPKLTCLVVGVMPQLSENLEGNPSGMTFKTAYYG
jgi:hypothetical protein